MEGANSADNEIQAYLDVLNSVEGLPRPFEAQLNILIREAQYIALKEPDAREEFTTTSANVLRCKENVSELRELIHDWFGDTMLDYFPSWHNEQTVEEFLHAEFNTDFNMPSSVLTKRPDAFVLTSILNPDVTYTGLDKRETVELHVVDFKTRNSMREAAQDVEKYENAICIPLRSVRLQTTSVIINCSPATGSINVYSSDMDFNANILSRISDLENEQSISSTVMYMYDVYLKVCALYMSLGLQLDDLEFEDTDPWFKLKGAFLSNHKKGIVEILKSLNKETRSAFIHKYYGNNQGWEEWRQVLEDENLDFYHSTEELDEAMVNIESKLVAKDKAAVYKILRGANVLEKQKTVSDQLLDAEKSFEEGLRNNEMYAKHKNFVQSESDLKTDFHHLLHKMHYTDRNLETNNYFMQMVQGNVKAHVVHKGTNSSETESRNALLQISTTLKGILQVSEENWKAAEELRRRNNTERKHKRTLSILMQKYGLNADNFESQIKVVLANNPGDKVLKRNASELKDTLNKMKQTQGIHVENNQGTFLLKGQSSFKTHNDVSSIFSKAHVGTGYVRLQQKKQLDTLGETEEAVYDIPKLDFLNERSINKSSTKAKFVTNFLSQKTEPVEKVRKTWKRTFKAFSKDNHISPNKTTQTDNIMKQILNSQALTTCYEMSRLADNCLASSKTIFRKSLRLGYSNNRNRLQLILQGHNLEDLNRGEGVWYELIACQDLSEFDFEINSSNVLGYLQTDKGFIVVSKPMRLNAERLVTYSKLVPRFIAYCAQLNIRKKKLFSNLNADSLFWAFFVTTNIYLSRLSILEMFKYFFSLPSSSYCLYKDFVQEKVPYLPDRLLDVHLIHQVKKMVGSIANSFKKAQYCMIEVEKNEVTRGGFQKYECWNLLTQNVSYDYTECMNDVYAAIYHCPKNLHRKPSKLFRMFATPLEYNRLTLAKQFDLDPGCALPDYVYSDMYNFNNLITNDNTKFSLSEDRLNVCLWRYYRRQSSAHVFFRKKVETKHGFKRSVFSIDTFTSTRKCVKVDETCEEKRKRLLQKTENFSDFTSVKDPNDLRFINQILLEDEIKYEEFKNYLSLLPEITQAKVLSSFTKDAQNKDTKKVKDNTPRTQKILFLQENLEHLVVMKGVPVRERLYELIDMCKLSGELTMLELVDKILTLCEPNAINYHGMVDKGQRSYYDREIYEMMLEFKILLWTLETVYKESCHTNIYEGISVGGEKKIKRMVDMRFQEMTIRNQGIANDLRTHTVFSSDDMSKWSAGDLMVKYFVTISWNCNIHTQEKAYFFSVLMTHMNKKLCLPVDVVYRLCNYSLLDADVSNELARETTSKQRNWFPVVHNWFQGDMNFLSSFVCAVFQFYIISVLNLFKFETDKFTFVMLPFIHNDDGMKCYITNFHMTMTDSEVKQIKDILPCAWMEINKYFMAQITLQLNEKKTFMSEVDLDFINEHNINSEQIPMYCRQINSIFSECSHRNFYEDILSAFSSVRACLQKKVPSSLIPILYFAANYLVYNIYSMLPDEINDPNKVFGEVERCQMPLQLGGFFSAPPAILLTYGVGSHNLNLLFKEYAEYFTKRQRKEMTMADFDEIDKDFSFSNPTLYLCQKVDSESTQALFSSLNSGALFTMKSYYYKSSLEKFMSYRHFATFIADVENYGNFLNELFKSPQYMFGKSHDSVSFKVKMFLNYKKRAYIDSLKNPAAITLYVNRMVGSRSNCIPKDFFDSYIYTKLDIDDNLPDEQEDWDNSKDYFTLHDALIEVKNKIDTYNFGADYACKIAQANFHGDRLATFYLLTLNEMVFNDAPSPNSTIFFKELKYPLDEEPVTNPLFTVLLLVSGYSLSNCGKITNPSCLEDDVQYVKENLPKTVIDRLESLPSLVAKAKGDITVEEKMLYLAELNTSIFQAHKALTSMHRKRLFFYTNAPFRITPNNCFLAVAGTLHDDSGYTRCTLKRKFNFSSIGMDLAADSDRHDLHTSFKALKAICGFFDNCQVRNVNRTVLHEYLKSIIINGVSIHERITAVVSKPAQQRNSSERKLVQESYISLLNSGYIGLSEANYIYKRGEHVRESWLVSQEQEKTGPFEVAYITSGIVYLFEGKDCSIQHCTIYCKNSQDFLSSGSSFTNRKLTDIIYRVCRATNQLLTTDHTSGFVNQLEPNSIYLVKGEKSKDKKFNAICNRTRRSTYLKGYRICSYEVVDHNALTDELLKPITHQNVGVYMTRIVGRHLIGDNVVVKDKDRFEDISIVVDYLENAASVYLSGIELSTLMMSYYNIMQSSYRINQRIMTPELFDVNVSRQFVASRSTNIFQHMHDLVRNDWISTEFHQRFSDSLEDEWTALNTGMISSRYMSYSEIAQERTLMHTMRSRKTYMNPIRLCLLFQYSSLFQLSSQLYDTDCNAYIIQLLRTETTDDFVKNLIAVTGLLSKVKMQLEPKLEEWFYSLFMLVAYLFPAHSEELKEYLNNEGVISYVLSADDGSDKTDIYRDDLLPQVESLITNDITNSGSIDVDFFSLFRKMFRKYCFKNKAEPLNAASIVSRLTSKTITESEKKQALKEEVHPVVPADPEQDTEQVIQFEPSMTETDGEVSYRTHEDLMNEMDNIDWTDYAGEY